MQLMQAQLFTVFESETDDLVNAPGAASGAYNGCSFVDYDNDGWLDLFWVRGGLFRNNGLGGFEKITTSGLRTDAGFGNTWSDFDNDGDIDVFVSGGNTRGSSMHKNNGDGTFTKVTEGILNDSLALKGWGIAFGDYDNNAYTDIVIAAPFGFAGITDGNKLLSNNGTGSFIRIDTSIICQGTAPYTIPSWSDYDHDGDVDCFIGSGPANGTVAVDYLYKNQFKETGIANYFTRITEAPIGTDLVDGQIWNWIDYDNDGDLDAYLTNYLGVSLGLGMPNNLYRNDAGTFIKMTAAEVGPIVSDIGLSLGSVWEDFDNDGDLDCFVTKDGPAYCTYYENNNGVFTGITSEPITDFYASHYGATTGDFDKDGDVDLFVSATNPGKKLFINSASENGNKWINIELKGVGATLIAGSNFSAIGAIVRIKANIHGETKWQMRELSAQNSFNSMLSLQAEFGLGDAASIDSLIVEWPSGIIDYCGSLSANHFYTMFEGACPEDIVSINNTTNNISFSLSHNPVSDRLTVLFEVSEQTPVTISITDSAGKNVVHQSYANLPSGENMINLQLNNLAAGVYYCNIVQGQQHATKLFTKQ